MRVGVVKAFDSASKLMKSCFMYTYLTITLPREFPSPSGREAPLESKHRKDRTLLKPNGREQTEMV